MVQITLYNNDTVDLFVSAIDNNQPSSPIVFPNQRLNQGQTSSLVSVQEDGNGNASISWTATDVNDPTRTQTKPWSGGPPGPVPVECS
jgi:hypothetical protein